MHIPAGGFTCCGGPVLEFTCTFLYEAPTPTLLLLHCDSYTHANHDTNTDGNSNCDCNVTHSNSYAQANAYTKSCSDAAAAAHRATPTAAVTLDVLGAQACYHGVVASLAMRSSKVAGS